jgi:hypothetical protein
MRIVHASDWHLGQELYGFDRAAEHEHFPGWLSISGCACAAEPWRQGGAL